MEKPINDKGGFMGKIDMIIKRDGREEQFNLEKIVQAIKKAMIEVEVAPEEKLVRAIASDVQTLVASMHEHPSVDDIQDAVEEKLLDKFPKVAIAFAKYRTKQDIKRKEGWNLSELGKRIYEGKYRHNDETFEGFLTRVSGGNSKIRKRILNKQFLFGGRILANRGLDKEGVKITLSNCYVLPSPEDNLESIYDTAKHMARTFSYGGGVGISLNKLRPKGMKVNNSAQTTTGAVSFAGTYSDVGERIGQNGRRGALMLTMMVNHPDIFDFIKLKKDLTQITSANMSIQISDKFMQAVEDNEMFNLHYECETGEIVDREVHAENLYNLICKSNWEMAEPGMLFWDTINNWHLMSAVKDYLFTCTNPCGELPLMDWGACLLGSINLASLVKNAFTPEATFDMETFIDVVHDAVIALNEAVDENIPLHPLQQQRDYARDYRAIGLGIMGLADMLLQMGMQYGSDRAVNISKTLGFLMINEAVFQSALLAKEHGMFPKCDIKAIMESEFFKCNITPEVQQMVEQYGLYNSQLLAIAPTGSLSTMLGVSGGIEPIFMASYTRKIESIGDIDEYFKVTTPVVQEYLQAYPTQTEDDVKTAINLPFENRIYMQSAWQQFVDNAISSTLNLPNKATVDDIKSIYMMAWKYGLKGITIYRDGCSRAGILSNHAKSEDDKPKVFACPECGGELLPSGGCKTCIDCGYSPCAL